MLPNPVLHAEIENGEPVVKTVNPAFENTFGYDSETITGEQTVLENRLVADRRWDTTGVARGD